ncbi:MAG: RhuM family protein [Bacteroidales bacterium]|jgi:hypothetical protein|nr:RhuM family protein [Bacteroidales bacterium]
MKNEIIIYQAEDDSTRLEVKVEDDSIWLTQSQIVELFVTSKANVSEHIKNIFKSGELNEMSTVRNIRTVRSEGGRRVNRDLVYYNLDVIISVGYRVNTLRGTQFRIWANNVLKDYLLKGYATNRRFNRIETDISELKDKFDTFDLQIQSSLPSREGIFFNGEVFDAYAFVSGLIRSANTSIILIDNYVDDTVLIPILV